MTKHENLLVHPVNRRLFNDALIHCKGIITGAGFETPAEALRLGKKLMVIPIRGQYEQYCNAAALERMGIRRIDDLDENFTGHFEQWLLSDTHVSTPSMSNEEIISNVMKFVSRFSYNYNDEFETMGDTGFGMSG